MLTMNTIGDWSQEYDQRDENLGVYMVEEKDKPRCLYVLCYNNTHNYYVGTATDLEERMLRHWRRDSDRIPKWSRANYSRKGFQCYWYLLGVDQSRADQCEAALGERLKAKIREITPDIKHRTLVGYGNCNETDELDPCLKPDEDVIKEINGFLLGTIDLVGCPIVQQLTCLSSYTISQEFRPNNPNIGWKQAAKENATPSLM